MFLRKMGGHKFPPRELTGRLKFQFTQFLYQLLRPIMPCDSPCKTFRRKQSLACYKLRFNSEKLFFEHYELFRITNPRAGEFYVFPIETLQKQDNRHFSYHKSGAFHWREANGERVIPLDGEADERNVAVMNQAVSHLFGQLDGYCLAVGPGTSTETLRSMIKILDGYILPPLEEIIPEELLRRRNFMIPIKKTPQKLEAQDIISGAIRDGKSRTMSAAEVEEMVVRETGGKGALIRLDPKSESYLVLDEISTKRIFAIGRELIEMKLGEKAPAFWKLKKR